MDDFAILVRIAIPGRPAVAREAILDTGSPFTVFPQSIWTQFQSRIRWLTKPNDPSLPRWCKQFAGAAGGRIDARLGRVQLTLHEARVGGNMIGPIDLLAMFALDRGRMTEPHILLGLGGGILSRRIDSSHPPKDSIVERFAGTGTKRKIGKIFAHPGNPRLQYRRRFVLRLGDEFFCAKS